MSPAALGRRRFKVSLAALAAFGVIALASGAARAQETARIVLLSAPGAAPGAEAVRAVLAVQLARVELAVEVVGVEALPESDADWTKVARAQAATEAGTLAVFGWRCGAPAACDLYVVETRSGGVARIPVRPDAAQDGGAGDGMAFAVAATVREAVWGGLLLEMSRLAEEGRNPGEPPPSDERLPAPYQGDVETGGLARAHRPWFWLEGGYHGEYAHPLGKIVHGPFVAFALSPGKNVVPVLRVGWLGMEGGEAEAGRVEAYRFPLELELRIAFPIGPAMFSFAPLGRVDVVVAKADPAGAQGESERAGAELHVGGITTWHLPLPGGAVEALVGVGVLATIIGSDLEVEGSNVERAATLRVIWAAGISWSPL